MRMVSKWFYIICGLVLCTVSAVSADPVYQPNQNASSCLTAHNETGECIRLEDCLVVYRFTFIANRSSEEKDYMERSRCGVSADEIISVCCPLSSNRPDTAELFDTRSFGKPKLGGNGNSLDENEKSNSNSAPEELRKKPGSKSCGPCATGADEQGACIRLVECSYMVHILLNNLTQSNKEYLRRSQCAFENGHVLVCCPFKTASDQANSFDGTSLLPTLDQCRVPSDDRIIGGNQTKIDEYTFMAVLGYRATGDDVTRFFCGGSLINNRYVLTAAHCTKTQIYYGVEYVLKWVRLGEWDLRSAEDCDANGDCNDTPPIDSAIEKVIVHESYRISKSGNDIALLRLAQYVPYSDWVSPICLPLAPHLRVATFLGDRMHISGWGVYINKRSPIKLKASVEVIDLHTCAKRFSRLKVSLEENQICAGGEEGIDSCFGDSGGPLIGIGTSNKLKQYYFVAGIISFGIEIEKNKCAVKDWPAVHVRVGHYVDWIRSKIRP